MMREVSPKNSFPLFRQAELLVYTSLQYIEPRPRSMRKQFLFHASTIILVMEFIGNTLIILIFTHLKLFRDNQNVFLYCRKVRAMLYEISMVVSLTTVCFSSMDQYLSTVIYEMNRSNHGDDLVRRAIDDLVINITSSFVFYYYAVCI